MRLEDTDEILLITGTIKRSIETLKKILRDETQFKLTASFGPGNPGIELPTELDVQSEVVREALKNWEQISIIDRIEAVRVLGIDVEYERMVK